MIKIKTTRTINIILVVLFFALAVWASYYISNNIQAQQLVNKFGYLGVTVAAFFGGLNILVPVPATTFTPLFLSSGLTSLGIIAALVIGTSIADIIAYVLGIFGREKTDPSKFKLFKKLESISNKNTPLLLILLFLWAAFVPFPNEAMLLPLGLLGFRFRSLLIPFLAGNIVHNTVIVFGVSNIIPFL